MQCSACGSAAVSTGLGNHVSCFTCGSHGEHLHVGEPSHHGDTAPAPDAEASESVSDEDGEE